MHPYFFLEVNKRTKKANECKQLMVGSNKNVMALTTITEVTIKNFSQEI
jgi:hypothetical protein